MEFICGGRLKKEQIQLSYHKKLGPKTKQVLRGITYTNKNKKFTDKPLPNSNINDNPTHKQTKYMLE